MEPFSSYPGGGNELLGRLRGTNARHEYGLQLQRITGEHACAYCGLDLTDTYEHWLLLQVDHVVPVSVALKLNIPFELYQDLVNCVLACSAFNGFDNRFTHVEEPPAVWSQAEFTTLRDRLFAMRKQRIAALHASERAFFETRPWIADRSPKRVGEGHAARVLTSSAASLSSMWGAKRRNASSTVPFGQPRR